jgi:hypothetical protein
MKNEKESWEEELQDNFCVMFERASREHGESVEEWTQKLEEWISDRFIEKSKVEEMLRIQEFAPQDEANRGYTKALSDLLSSPPL